MEMSLQPSEEIVGIDPSYQWNLPHGAKGKPRRKFDPCGISHSRSPRRIGVGILVTGI